MPVAVHRPEHRARDSVGSGQPRQKRLDRAEFHAVRDRDRLAGALLIGFGAANQILNTSSENVNRFEVSVR